MVKVDKGTSIHLQFEDKSVNTDDIFQVEQCSRDEARKEVAYLKQENVQRKEKLLKVTSPVTSMNTCTIQTGVLYKDFDQAAQESLYIIPLLLWTQELREDMNIQADTRVLVILQSWRM